MGLWIVWNGWIGSASTGALVEAADRQAAIAAGMAALRAEAERPRPALADGPARPTYPESYWRPDRLEADRVHLPLVGGFDVPVDED